MKHMSVEEVADLLGLSTGEVLRLARRQHIRAERDGNTWGFTHRDVKRWLNQTAPESTPTGSAPEFGINESQDLENITIAQPGGWEIAPVNQLSKGLFSTRIRFINMPGVTVYDNHWDCAVRVYGEAPQDFLMMGTDVSPERTNINWCGQKVDFRRFACTESGSAIDFSVSEHSHNVVLLIEPELLQKTAGADAVGAIQDGYHLGVDHAAGRRLTHTILNLLDNYETRSLLLEQPGVLNQVRSQVLGALEDCSRRLQSGAAELSPGRREEAVAAALAYADLVRGQTSTWDMAQAAGVSQRTLEYAFKQSLGLSPGKYLGVLRLNEARHALARARPGDRTVTEIALKCGFTHMGRFSRSYRELFAEKPSRTLAKYS